MMNVDQIFTLLLGAGGAGGLAGLYNVWRTLKKGKLEDEETLIKRLDKDNKDKDSSIDGLEKSLSRMRGQRNRVWDQAARYRRALIAHGVDDSQLEPLVDFDD